MAEYKVTINATPSKAKVISVSPKNVQNTITASPDTSLYYSNLSKKWATEMDGMVNGEDYSSKYYANVSAENAQITNSNVQACEDARVLLQSEYNEYTEELNATFGELESEANTIVTTGKSELQTELSNLRTSASSITSTSKTDIQNTATSAKNTAISAIQTQQTTSVNAVKTEGTTQVNLAKAQATAAANSATQASNVVKEVEDDLASKVDIDDMVQVDFADAGSYIAGCAMPSDKYVTLTVGATSTTYIAPENGYFVSDGTANNADSNLIQLRNAVTGLGMCAIRTSTNAVRAFMPVLKGQTIYLDYRNIDNIRLAFVYAQGSGSEVQ